MTFWKTVGAVVTANLLMTLAIYTPMIIVMTIIAAK